MGRTSRRRLLSVLSAVLEAVRDGSAQGDALVRICNALTATVPCDRATVYVWSRRRRQFLPVADYGTPGEVVTDFIQRGYGPRMFPGDAELRAGRTVVAVRDQATDGLAETLEIARLHALAVIPLRLGAGAEGALACGLHHPPAFTPAQLAVLDEVGPNIAVLIQNARLQAEARRLAERRTNVATWSAEVLAAPDPRAMETRLCDASCRLFRATRAVVLTLHGDVLVVHRPDDPSGLAPIHIPVASHTLAAETLRTGKIQIVNRFAETEYARTPLLKHRVPAAVLTAPLCDADGALGVLAVVEDSNPYRFGPDDETDAQLFASVATVALRKGRLLDALTRASTAKSEFLASVSHDLRTPLIVIIGYAQLLSEETFGPVTPDQADTLARVLRTATAQVGLVNDLLDLARIEQGKLACDIHPVALGSLVPALRETMELLLRDRPIRFEVAVAPDAVVATDPERLRQVLVNLLANAAKFTHAGCVRLVAARVDEHVCLSVEDTGPGMDPALGPDALEPFVRGAHESTGSGLGLAIVARLLPLLGGRLSIDSEPGRGTQVRLRLPAA